MCVPSGNVPVGRLSRRLIGAIELLRLSCPNGREVEGGGRRRGARAGHRRDRRVDGVEVAVEGEQLVVHGCCVVGVVWASAMVASGGGVRAAAVDPILQVCRGGVVTSTRLLLFRWIDI